MTTDSTSHGIIAQQWQLEAAAKHRLKAIVFPLKPQIKEHPQTLSWNHKRISRDLLKSEPFNDDSILQFLDYQFGDHLYLGEPWGFGFINGLGANPYPLHYFPDDDHILDAEGLSALKENDPAFKYLVGAQPAATMPPEAAHYQYEITGVRVCQAKNLSFQDFADIGFIGQVPVGDMSTEENIISRMSCLILARLRWNEAFPEREWTDDMWMILLEIKEL